MFKKADVAFAFVRYVSVQFSDEISPPLVAFMLYFEQNWQSISPNNGFV